MKRVGASICTKPWVVRATIPLLLFVAFGWGICATQNTSRVAALPAFSSQHFADYDAELRRPDGRVDVDSMVARLHQLGVTTYYWLVWHAATDWDDLKLFLPKAAQANIAVWVYLVPPTESPPHVGTQFSEPFRLDYKRWAEEIARLSLQHTNLTAWVIDDFYANHELFSPAYLREMQARAKRINPRLAFLPLMYFNEITRKFADDYHEVIDGVVVAYPQDRDEIAYARAILNGETAALPGQFSFPWNTPSAPGDFASAGLAARVTPASRCSVRFREQDDFTGPTSGYHFKQLLLDDVVVWEEDVAGGTAGWRDMEVDLAGKLPGRTNVTLAFRLVDRKGVSNFGVRWRVRDLRTEGLEPVASWNEPQNWQVRHRGHFEAGFGKASQKSARRFQIPFMVMTAADAGEFKQRHGEPASPARIAEWLRMCLQAKSDHLCEGVVTYCLDKRTNSETFLPARQLFQEFRTGK